VPTASDKTNFCACDVTLHVQAVFAACSACVIVVRGDSVSGCSSTSSTTDAAAAGAVAFVVKESTVYSAAVMAEQTDLQTLLHSGVPARASCLVVVPTSNSSAGKSTAGGVAKVRGLHRC
jgi:Mur ligase family, catalytic domain